MKIAFTGHRPDKLGGYNDATNKRSAILSKIDEIVSPLHDVEFIVGMALGVDQWAAEYAIDHGIPFHAYIPCPGQELVWPEKSQERYRFILSHAETENILSQTYTPGAMYYRNECMVNDGDLLIAVYDGSAGGTRNCINYAKQVGRKIIFIEP